MGQADGTILIDTSISDDGLVAGTKDVEAAARRMAESVSGIADKAKVALQKQVDSFAKLNSQYDEQARKVEELKSKVEDLKGEKIPTQEYTDLNKEIDSVSKKLDAVIERQIKFVEIGGNRNSQTFKAMEYDIDMLRQKLEEAQQAKAKLESSGGAYTTGIDTESGQKTMAQYTSAQAALENTLNRLKTSYADLNEKTKEYNSETKKASKSTGDFQKNLGKTSVSFKKMLSYAFGIRSLFALFNRIRSAVTDGMKNLVQYSGSTNSTVSGLMGSLTQLKNALATAFAPILTAVAPALNYLISLLTTAATAVGRFFSALTGQSTFVKATKVQENYADSLKKTGSAAKKAEKSLASFDTIEQIGSKSSDSGGGGGSSTNPKDMFTTEQISSSIKEMADKIRQMVAAEDWQGVGNYIGSQIGNGVNFGMSKLDQFLSTTNWKGIGTAITAGLTGFFSTFSWSTLSSTVSHFIAGAVQLITGLLKGVDWRSIPQGIIDAIGGILKGFDYASVFGSVGELIGTAIASGIDLLKGLGDVLVNSWNSVVSYFSGYIDASGGNLVLGLYNGIVNALKSVGSWIVNNIFKPFINGFKSAFGIHSPSTVMMEMGQYLMEGLRNGVSNFISSVIAKFSEIKDKIVGKWTETKKKTEETWNNIKNWLGTNWTSVKTSASEKFQNIKDTIAQRWAETKSGTQTTWESVKSVLLTTWETIRTNASTKFADMKKAIIDNWTTLKSQTKTIWDGIWGAIRSVINTILGGVESMVNGVITALNRMISALNNLSFDVPDWVPGIGGETFGLDIPTVGKVHLPRLASGTVVPPRAGEFAAILGDNKRETEVVSPLSTMKQALMEALAESGISGGSQQVVIRFEGNLAQLGRVLKPVIDSENNRTGVRLVTGGSR